MRSNLLTQVMPRPIVEVPDIPLGLGWSSRDPRSTADKLRDCNRAIKVPHTLTLLPGAGQSHVV